MCKISVLIPIYNVEKYLRQCLDSVVNQTLKDIEIICINDGSTDSSLKIINEYASQDSRIKVIDKKNTGYGHSMNCGLKAAQGEYIGIVESDDFADLKMFDTLYNTAKKFNAEVVKSNYWEQVSDYSRFIEVGKLTPYEEIFIPINNNSIFQAPTSIWSAIYSRSFLLKNDIYFNETPGASYQDVSFVFKVLACTERLFFIKEAFLHYRKDNPNSSVKSKEKVYCIFDEFNEIERFLKERKDIYNLCKYIIEPLKYKHYIFNFNRMADNFKFIFYKRMSEDLETDNIAGYFDKNYWQENKWKEVQLLLSNKNEFFYHQYEKNQKYRAYVIGFLSKLKTYSNIYIYGAGKAATNVLFKLYQRNIPVKGVLVSDMNNNPAKLFDISVTAFKGNNIDKEHDVILIATKEEHQYNIFYELQSEGYYNIILITEELREALNL